MTLSGVLRPAAVAEGMPDNLDRPGPDGMALKLKSPDSTPQTGTPSALHRATGDLQITGHRRLAGARVQKQQRAASLNGLEVSREASAMDHLLELLNA